MPTRQDILESLPEHTNDPARFLGANGYWVQGDCVFIEADTPQAAIMKYRARMPKAQVGISHNLHCDAILYRQCLEAQKAKECQA